jgi:hypothetical protein
VLPLTSPTVIHRTTAGNITLNDAQDYVVLVHGLIQQTSGTTNVLGITGGRRVWVLGVDGARLRDGRDGKESQTNILVWQNGIEGMFIDSIHFDAIDAMNVDSLVPRGYAPYGTSRSNWRYPDVWVQNFRFDGAKWSGGDPHPDNIQKQTALGNVRLFNGTMSFRYQSILCCAQSFSLRQFITSGPQEQWIEGLRSGGPGYASTTPGELRFEKTNTYRTTGVYTGPAYWLGHNTSAGWSGFPGENPFPVRFIGQENYVKGGGVHSADTVFGGGGLVYPTGIEYVPGSRSYGGGYLVNSVAGSDALGPYVTWVPAAQIEGLLRFGDPPDGDHVPLTGEKSLEDYTSPFALPYL